MGRQCTARSRRVAAALAAGITVGALSGAGGAVAAPPPAASSVELAPQLGVLDQALIADDAVFFSDTPNETQAIYRRPMTAGPAGTAIGDAEIVAFGVGYGRFAEHEGTLAYARASDGRLAFRASDGATTSPAWAAPADVAGGVLALTDAWVVARDSFGGDFAGVTLFNRADGGRYTLGDLVGPPAGFDWSQPLDVVVTDTRLLWSVVAFTEDGMERNAVYTVALGADGPTGPALELAAAVYDQHGAGPLTFFNPVDATGSRVMWERHDCVDPDACVHTLDSYAAAPYTGTPESRVISGDVFTVEGETAVLMRDSLPTVTLDWVDIADLGTVVRTADVRPSIHDVAGALVVHSAWSDGSTTLSDASGGAVTITTTQVPVLHFVDVDWSDPFVTHVQWMVDEGIATGYGDGTFRNTAPVNRDAMAAFLYRTAHGGGRPAGCSTAAFADVAPGHPFCPEIRWLAETGTTTGWADGTYRGGEPVTREAMAAFLFRFAHGGADAPACTTAPFTDVRVANPFCGEIAWLVSTGITTGWPDGTFRPGASIERQAMAAFLFRFVHAGLAPAT